MIINNNNMLLYHEAYMFLSFSAKGEIHVPSNPVSPKEHIKTFF